MTATWHPDRIVDEPLARQLVDRFPEVRGAPIRPFAQGWDRAVWLVDDQWAFGFPRRQAAIRGFEREIEWLPRFAPHLPVSVPVPRFVGQPTEDFPWPYFGSAFIPGAEPTELDDDARTALGVELARFLRALHRLDGTGLPDEGNYGADMRARVPKTREALAGLDIRDCSWLLDAAEALPDPPPATTVAHGDLHFRQVLVERDRLSGVIDWVDVCRSDPCIDLMMLWNFVPPSGRAAFLDEYGPVRDDQLLRARAVALNMSAVLAHFARDEGMPTVEAEALRGLERALSG